MTTPSVQEMALAVAAALEDESRFCTGAFARDEQGSPVASSVAFACAWCARGHGRRLFGNIDEARLRDAYSARFEASIDQDNDDPARGREYVRARLIELANATEGT